LIKRRREQPMPEHRLLRGPGCLCKGLGITGAEDATGLVAGPVQILDAARVEDHQVGTSPRIGVAYAGDDARLPWRFYVEDSRAVSGPARLRG
jgi:DNA-3-methyladenine glycosylase